MNSRECSICHLPKANLDCELCEKAMCKRCSQKLPGGSFSLWPVRPEHLKKTLYCGICFDEKVAPELQKYESLEAKARLVNVFHKGQGEETRLFKRLEKPIKVDNGSDRSETLMHLAFQAAKNGFNCLLDVSILSEKTFKGNYQSTKWSGVGIPTNVDESKLSKPR
jgi:hypothetical protein